MIKSIFFFVIILILSITQFVIAQGEFHSYSKCENSIKFLENHCFNCNNDKQEGKCKVEAFYYLGKVQNRYYYCSTTLAYDSLIDFEKDGKFNHRDIIILEGTSKKKVKPVYSTGGGLAAIDHATAELVSNKFGSFIHIFIASGKGLFDEGEFFIFRNNTWDRLTVPDFDGMFKDAIPKNCNFNYRGGWIDLKNFTYNRTVYKENEPTCCPTGGKLIAYLKLTSDNKIVVTKTKYFPEQN